MFKKLFSVVLCCSLILVPWSSTFAASSTDAWSVGTYYKDGYISGLIGSVDTTDDAITAADFYGSMGYKSAYSTSPTYQIMRGRFSNNNYRMESAVQFYSGHANNECIAYNYNNSGGDYKTGVYYGSNYDSSKGYKYAGIKSYNLNSVKLITFAGCNTATNGDDNIVAAAHNAGATTTIGWTESIGSGSHSNWLKRYNDYLNKGYTVSKAISHADSFSYLDNKVKKHKVYGNKNLTLTSSKRALNNDYPERETFTINYNDEAEVFDKIKNFNTEFKIDNYIVEEIVNDSGKIYDLYLLKDGYKTLDGYTIILTEGKAEVYRNNSYDELSETIIPKNINSLSYLESDVLNNVRITTGDEGNYNILSKEIILDVSNSRKVMYYRIENVLDNGAKAVIEYYEEV